MYVFALAVMCVFLALAALYESWSLPLAVILVVPLCLLCFRHRRAVHATRRSTSSCRSAWWCWWGWPARTRSSSSSSPSDLHAAGQSRYEATVEASRLRLRPILMTSFAFILGVVPLVIATGAGAEMRRSLGTAVFSGMIGVTLFGIFLTPVFFYVIQGLSETPAVLPPSPCSGSARLLLGGSCWATGIGFSLVADWQWLADVGPVAGRCCAAALGRRLMPASDSSTTPEERKP